MLSYNNCFQGVLPFYFPHVLFVFMEKMLVIFKGSNTSGKHPSRPFHAVYNFFIFHKLNYKTVNVNYFLITVSEGLIVV